MALKHDYDGLLELLGPRRKQVLDFLVFLENETSWLEAPASSRHHLNVPGGLIIHSLLTTRTMLDIRDALAPEYDDETCVIVGLFQDVGKIGLPGNPLYLRLDKPEGNILFRSNQELVTMGVAVRSLFLIAPHVRLSAEEAQAVCYHDGQYIPDNLVVKNHECPLTLLVHFADLWSSHVKEEVTTEPPVQLKEHIK